MAMNGDESAPEAATATGSLRGRWDDGVASFRGIPYAEPPVGPLRWAPPRAVRPWDGTRTAVEPGPIAPQPPARLQPVMGPMESPGPDEDCLTLNVWTAEPGPDSGLPVLVFLHGGGYLSGAGSAAWHDGAGLAGRGPAVVVTLNYRLGALGYLYLPSAITGGDTIANLGLLDQRLALEWIATNVEAFGGDANRITVFGQSGGAHSIAGLHALPSSSELFGRAILQSAPLGMAAAPAEDAETVTNIFLAAAGVADGNIDDLRQLQPAQILEAQRETLMRTATLGRLEPPFQLVVDGATLSDDPSASARAGALADLELLVGFTADEARAFYAVDDALWALDAEPLIERIRETAGDVTADRLRTYASLTPGPAAAALSDMVSDELIVAPSIELAEGNADAGGKVYQYRFSWISNALEGRLGACHTIELPFVFSNRTAWNAAPMLGDSAPEDRDKLSSTVQDAWLAFAAAGNPTHPGLPRWDPYEAAASTTVDLGGEVRTLQDPAGGRRHLWRSGLPESA
jgi:para-nitrobenzyl esterase